MAKANEALGMIECKGFIALLEASDAMLRAWFAHDLRTWVEGLGEMVHTFR